MDTAHTQPLTAGRYSGFSPSSFDDMVANHKAVQRRFTAKKKPPLKAIENLRPAKRRSFRPPAPPKPLLSRTINQAHLDAYRQQQVDFANEVLQYRTKFQQVVYEFKMLCPVPWNEITSTRRNVIAATWRQALIHAVKLHTDFSLKQVGRLIGNRDHTTVLHSVNKVEKCRASGNYQAHTVDGNITFYVPISWYKLGKSNGE